MNLTDAIKSGKPFKRKGSDEWCRVHGDYVLPDRYSENEANFGVYKLLMPSQILADDWEIQEPTVALGL